VCVKGAGGSTPGRQDGRGVEELREAPVAEEAAAWGAGGQVVGVG
jgi:hypothetical protein